MPTPPTRSLIFEDGSRVFLHCGKQMLTGRPGVTGKKLSADYSKFADAKAVLRDLSRSAGIEVSERYQIISSNGDEVEIRVEPDFIVKILPENDDNDQASRRISHAHAAFYWDGDEVRITDPGSGTKLWEGGRRIENGEIVRDGMKLDLISGRFDLQMFLHRDKNGRVYALRTERLNNYEQHRYLFFRDCITVGSASSCDIKLDGEGDGVWGKIYVKNRRLGIEPVEGAPRLYVGGKEDNTLVPAMHFAALANGSSLMWEGGPVLMVKGGEPGEAGDTIPEEVEIKEIFDLNRWKEELTEVSAEAYDESKPARLIELIESCPSDEVLEEALKKYERVLKKKRDGLIDHIEIIDKSQESIGRLMDHGKSAVRVRAKSCFEVLAKYLRRQYGPQIAILLRTEEHIVQGKQYQPALIITNLGRKRAREVNLEIIKNERRYGIDHQNVQDLICEQIQPDQQMESDKEISIIFNLNGSSVRLETKITYKDDIDNELQVIEKVLKFKVLDKPSNEMIMNYYTIGELLGPGAVKIQEAVIRDMDLHTGDSSKYSGSISIDGSIVRHSEIG